MRDTRAACAVTPGERAVRGVLAAAAGTVAAVAGTSGRPWCAVPAAVCGTLLAVGAATGWCPTDLLRRREPAVIGSDHGYPDARELVHLSMSSSRGGTA